MIFWVCFAGYATAALIAARLVFYAMRLNDDMAPHGAFESTLVAILCMIAGLFWPLAPPIALVMWHPRKTPAELREQLAARDRRIAELEREAGIGP